jgi:hypothetical protein
MVIDPEKNKNLNEYLDDIFPEDPHAPHPFKQFRLNEIVIHATWGHGIVTGFRIPDLDRELEGLGVQFVEQGQMKKHRVFTPRECCELIGSGIEFKVSLHTGMKLEDVLNARD